MEVFNSSCCRGRLCRCSAIDQLGGLSASMALKKTDSNWSNSYSHQVYPYPSRNQQNSRKLSYRTYHSPTKLLSFTPSGCPKMLWALASANANELNVLPIPSASKALVKQEVIGVVEGARPRTPNQLRSSSAETSVLWSFCCSTFEESHCHQWPR